MPAKLNFEYIKQKIEQNGYILVSTDYKDSKTKLVTKCPVGHQYIASYNSFKHGYRCSECAGLKKKTIEEVRLFIESEGYILLSTHYMGNKSKLLTKCPKGHDFYIRWNDFQQGYRCNECYGNKKKTIQEARKLFNDNGYKIIDTEYTDYYFKFNTICPNNHTYLVSYNDFLQGNRCSECAGTKKKTIEEVKTFIEKKGYTLSSSKYENSSTKLSTICPKGHNYHVTWADFKNGYRCYECSRTKKKTIHEIREALLICDYQLISTIYKHNKSLLYSKCSKGHDFYIRWNDFIKGVRCPICQNKGTSKPEQELLSILKTFFPNLIKKTFLVSVLGKPHIQRFQVDIFNPDTNLGIEYDGQYHHSEEFLIKNKTQYGWSIEDAKNYHSIKDAALQNCHDIKIIHIKGDDWKKNKQACIAKCLDFLSSKS